MIYPGDGDLHELFAFSCGLETSRDLRIIVACDFRPQPPLLKSLGQCFPDIHATCHAPE
jgi:hypothetical protein